MITRYPLTWPASRPRTPADQRSRAIFGIVKTDAQYGYKSRKALSIAEACGRIISELKMYTRAGRDWRVDPEEVIISTNLKYRQDGLPYSNQKEPEDPGAAVYFTLDEKQYCLPCDKWDRIADNLAAIAAHIAANRGIERWGVGESSDVYAGYAALPAPGQSTVLGCWDILGIAPTKYRIDIDTAYKAKAKTAHPDNGGSDSDMSELNIARQQALQYAQS